MEKLPEEASGPPGDRTRVAALEALQAALPPVPAGISGVEEVTAARRRSWAARRRNGTGSEEVAGSGSRGRSGGWGGGPRR